MRNIERVVRVFLWDWIAWLQLYTPAAIIIAPAIVMFAWQYGASKRRSAYRVNVRLDRLHRSLELYTAATGALLREAGSQRGLSAAEHAALVDKLLACKAAPYVTEDLLTQIAAYMMEERDSTRLTLLLRTLERETERLMEERSTLLRRSEKPGWGWTIWQQIQHALPFAFTAGLFILLLWFLGSLDQASQMEEERWAVLYVWSRFLSCLFSLLVMYPFLRGGRRESSSSLLQRWLAVAIGLAALLHFIGLTWAPYVLTLQLLLFLTGFRFSHNRPRKSRPFVGHYFEEDELSLLQEQLTDLPDEGADAASRSKNSPSP
ncbi:hypothetical protein [Paenibacillus sp. YSY-4.3]